MPIVVFETPQSNPLEIYVPGGGRLIDVCDDECAPVPFSCRSASCGTCRIDVIDGAELLEPAADEELDVLDIFNDDPARRRLACQARFRSGPGRLLVRPAED